MCTRGRSTIISSKESHFTSISFSVILSQTRGWSIKRCFGSRKSRTPQMDVVSVLLNFFILRQGRSFFSLFWVITRGFKVSFTFCENAEIRRLEVVHGLSLKPSRVKARLLLDAKVSLTSFLKRILICRIIT